jgi:hypothetical protein
LRDARCRGKHDSVLNDEPETALVFHLVIYDEAEARHPTAAASRPKKLAGKLALKECHVEVYLSPMDVDVPVSPKVTLPVPPTWSSHSMRTMRVESGWVFQSYIDKKS